MDRRAGLAGCYHSLEFYLAMTTPLPFGEGIPRSVKSTYPPASYNPYAPLRQEAELR